MDANTIDRLARSFAAAGSRRGLLRLLAAPPLAGGLAPPLAEGSEAARHRRAHGRDRLQAQRKKKNKKKCAKAGQAPSKKRKKCCKGLSKDGSGVCAAACTPASCAPNACGSMPDGCGGTLTCACTGNTVCIGETCQPCDVCFSGCPFSTVQAAVNAASGGATIHICAGIYPGDIVIDQSLTLIGAGDGTGPGITILQGSGTDSVVTIFSGNMVSIQAVRITGGGGPTTGGGIASSGTLALTACTITGNKADNNPGGGILNGGTLTLNGCTVSGNMAFSGGGIYNAGGTVQLINSTVSINTAENDGGGIGNAGVTVELINSEVTGNDAGDRGGGIYNQGMLTLDAASRVTGNDADEPNNPDSGGGIYNAGGTVMGVINRNVFGNTPDNCNDGAVPGCVDPP